MQRGKSGYDSVMYSGRKTVRAFVPKPLPPEPPITLADGLKELLESAAHALGQLDVVSTLLPETALFLYTYVRKEAVLSSQIEGVQSSLSDLLLFELAKAPGAPTDDIREVSITCQHLSTACTAWETMASSVKPPDPRGPREAAFEQPGPYQSARPVPPLSELDWWHWTG